MCSSPTAAAQAPALSSPIQRNAIQLSNATNRFVKVVSLQAEPKAPVLLSRRDLRLISV